MLADMIGRKVGDLFIYDELRWRIKVNSDLVMQRKADDTWLMAIQNTTNRKRGLCQRASMRHLVVTARWDQVGKQ